ncbi:MAG: NHLP bacteriocin export ABC transporter permease/ATPase subunit [Clostridiales bacterium]|jgi:NHLM bacteriocin system ABC transporter ATP-binding protein|nr:NHLP bacteriocin export ABC transporter permease/ATPase subunit [Clostridiales bacterium]
MGWFENQIEERRNADNELLEDSFFQIAGVILGERSAQKFSDERIITKNAIDEVLRYYHYKPVDVPESITDPMDQLDYALRPHGVMYRTVDLTPGWYKDAFGPMLGRLEDGTVVALIPHHISGYTYKDPETDKIIKVGRNNEAALGDKALVLYKPLPKKKLKITDLIAFMRHSVTMTDIVMLIAATLAITVIGLVMPRATKALTGPVRMSGSSKALIGIAVCMVAVTISSQLMTSVQGLVAKRLDTKTSVAVQSAMMMRLMSLPASFFRQYSPGELKSRAMSVSQLCSILMGLVITSALSSLSSLLYVTQIFHFAAVLVIPSLVIMLVTVAFSTITTLIQINVNRKQLQVAAKESGMSYAMISGVQKIKLAGAEKRMFARWLNLYAQEAELTYNPPLFIKINPVITTAITLVSNIVLYYLAVESGIDQSSYFAFMTAYGMVMGAFTTLAGTALSAAQIQPILEMAEPFLNAEPETTEGRELVTSISGGVEMDHVTFRYSDDTPYIVRDISFKIKPGEYVAIVGKTGCGKSTIMRLLLGFEKPEKGAIYFDGKDINSMDLGTLRRNIGTVMQSSGLFQGDIYSNIVITDPELTLDDAWEAAEKAGIADDIREMPMGMHTIISEGQGGISGGQRQRIMIARAIAPKPKLLMFDEATSALDNKTQRQVSEALDAMGCTRIVIAHRLSTIRHCDRILVLDGGRIIEDGNYDELIAKKGFFAELVERQRLDNEDFSQAE